MQVIEHKSLHTTHYTQAHTFKSLHSSSYTPVITQSVFLGHIYFEALLAGVPEFVEVYHRTIKLSDAHELIKILRTRKMSFNKHNCYYTTAHTSLLLHISVYTIIVTQQLIHIDSYTIVITQ